MGVCSEICARLQGRLTDSLVREPDRPGWSSTAVCSKCMGRGQVSIIHSGSSSDTAPFSVPSFLALPGSSAPA